MDINNHIPLGVAPFKQEQRGKATGAASAGGLHEGGSVARCADETQNLVTDQVMSIEEVERILDETQEAVDYQRVRVAVSGLPSGSQGVWWPAAHPAREGQAFPRHTGAACLHSRESSLGPGLSPSSVRGHLSPRP